MVVKIMGILSVKKENKAKKYNIKPQLSKYNFCLRMEDITDPGNLVADPKCDRNITLYGYVRGTHLRKNVNVHIPGKY